MRKKTSKKKGFTLIELIVVIAIITILVAVAVPKYQKSRRAAAIAAHKSNYSMLETAGIVRLSDMPANSAEETWTSKNEYVEKRPELPKGLKGEGYKVVINPSDGTVTVTPAEDAFDEETEGGTQNTDSK